MNTMISKIADKDRRSLWEIYDLSDEYIDQRGYISIQDKSDVDPSFRIDFDLHLPELFVPSYSSRGELSYYFSYSRHSLERNYNGYFRASQKRIGEEENSYYLDCPPICINDLQTSKKPIYLTQSPFVADALANRQLCSMALLNFNNKQISPEDISLLSNLFEPILLENREIRFVRNYSEIFNPVSICFTYPIIKALKTWNPRFSIVYCKQSLWTSRYAFIWDILGGLRVENLPNYNELIKTRNAYLEKDLIVIIAMIEQVFESRVSFSKIDTKKFQFIFSSSSLFERINCFFQNIQGNQLKPIVTMEFIAVTLYSLGFTPIYDANLNSEDWVCTYSQFIDLLNSCNFVFKFLR